MADSKTAAPVTTAQTPAAAPAPARVIHSPTSVPDGPAPEGKDVKEGDLVQTCAEGAYVFVDPITNVSYPAGVWTEAQPSTWIDRQVAAGKMRVK